MLVCKSASEATATAAPWKVSTDCHPSCKTAALHSSVHTAGGGIPARPALKPATHIGGCQYIFGRISSASSHNGGHVQT